MEVSSLFTQTLNPFHKGLDRYIKMEKNISRGRVFQYF